MFDLAFHPNEPVVAMCTIAGEVQAHRYAIEGNIQLFASNHHTESCRSCCFDDNGRILFTVSSDGSIGTIDARDLVIDSSPTVIDARGLAIDSSPTVLQFVPSICD